MCDRQSGYITPLALRGEKIECSTPEPECESAHACNSQLPADSGTNQRLTCQPEKSIFVLSRAAPHTQHDRQAPPSAGPGHRGKEIPVPVQPVRGVPVFERASAFRTLHHAGVRVKKYSGYHSVESRWQLFPPRQDMSGYYYVPAASY